MKPLRMRMQAFGPYADVATVDFRDLSHGGLFLIHGPTGAGKTSILDGLCFSLFGRSSGSERAPENLRCDRAPASLTTEVQLEFALGARVYKVIRRPRQIVKKQRGEGLTSTPAKGELFESLEPLQRGMSPSLNDLEWTLIASGEKKTDDRVTELLGMNEEQFRQVVVLPQGQFRKFLSSSSDDREELLETLFRTEQYRELTERLQARASLMAQEIHAKRQGIQSQLSLTGCENSAALEVSIQSQSDILHNLLVNETEHELKFAEALSRRDLARVYARDLAELKATLLQAEKLSVQKPEIEKISLRLENERRARSVLAIDTQVLQIAANIAELESQKKSETLAASGFEQILNEKQKTKAQLILRKHEIEAMQAERTQLQLIYTDAKNLSLARQELVQNQSSLKAADKKFELEKLALKNSRDSRQALQLEIEKRTDVVHNLASARIAFEKISTAAQWLEREMRVNEETDRRVLSAKKSLDLATADFQKVTLANQQLKLKYHLSQASQLAHLLRVNEECPVCGSLEHPKPAHSTLSAEQPGPEEIEKADRELKRGGEEVSAARARHEAVLDEAAKSLAAIGSHLKVKEDILGTARAEAESLKQKSLMLKDEMKALEQDERRLIEAKQKLDALERQMGQLEQTHESLRQMRDETQKTFERTGQIIAGLELRVPEPYRDLDVITKRGQSLRLEIDLYAKATENIEREVTDANDRVVRTLANIKTFSTQLVSKSAQAAALTEQLELAIQQEKFSSVSEARAAALTADTARNLERTKTAFENDWASNQSRLKTLQSQLAEIPAWANDLSQVEAAYGQLERERRERISQVAELKAKTEALESVLRRTKLIEAEMIGLEEKYRVLGKLSAVANGQPPHNLTRVNFQRYVLAARLDEVLDQASRRLFLMSRGQFILRRSKGADDKRKNAGLDLEVEDSFTGTCRPTSSLSGGEGFLASLSLALGLADVVQSRLGGVRLDAVFVDEGFGTLDTEALELAIKTLSELQAGGRIVGIISHVPELREQIAHRLHVRKTATGSSVGWENASS